MLLDELVGVIETLKSRIQEHRSTLSSNETRTRNALIDPLLTVLGWDTADPALVTMEYNVGSGRADYALLTVEGKPRVFLEAKRLGESLHNHRSQIVTYAVELGTPYSALSNGDQWEIYDTFKQVPMDDKRILDLSISRDDSAKVSLKMLLLWRANVTTGNPQPAQESVLTLEDSTLADLNESNEAVSDSCNGVDPGWTTLTDFEAVKGSKPPYAIRFDDGEEREILFWYGIPVEVAEYLVRRGLLSKKNCPVSAGYASGYCMVNVSPEHPNGKAFPEHERLSNGLFLYSLLGSVDGISSCIGLLEHCGQDPSQVWLKTG